VGSRTSCLFEEVSSKNSYLFEGYKSVAAELATGLKDAKYSSRNRYLFRRCKSVVAEFAPY